MTKILTPSECTDKRVVGNKAYNLARLKAAGFKVPDFLVIPPHEVVIPCEAIDNFTDLISVRSGSLVSLAGILKSHLNITRDSVYEKISSVQESWNHPITQEIVTYLKLDPNLGTAVILQKMVPKNILLGSGVVSSIHPITKENKLYISYQKEVYGENVVLNGGNSHLSKSEETDLIVLVDTINHLFNGPQEIEFCNTTEGFYILQSRDLVINQIQFNDAVLGSKIGLGVGSVQGVIQGSVCFENPSEGDILCLKNLNPSELSSVIKAKAVLARSGDHNSHLAVLCRLLNKPYILAVNLTERIETGNLIALNTDSGEVFKLN